MTVALDKRTWLAERGLAIAGTRGKFSNAAKEALAAAEKAGTVFIDKKVVAETAKVERAEQREADKAAKPSVDAFKHHSPAIRTGELTFVGSDRRKHKVAAANACHACSYSFGWCQCEVPTFSDWKTGQVWKLQS